MRRPTVGAASVAIGAALVVPVSALLPWITAGIGESANVYSGLQIAPVLMPVAAAAVLTVTLAGGALWISGDLARYAVLTSGIGAVFAAATIALAETTALVIPASLLPKTADRALSSLGAGYGIWLALAGLTVSAVAMHGRLSAGLAERLRFSQQGKRVIALLGLVTLTVLVGWLRYRTWIDASAFGQNLGLPAWAAPWIGPLSLVAVWMLGAATLVLAFYSSMLAGLLAAAAGWMISFLAALVVIAVGAFGRLGLADLLPASATNGPGFHATEFVWIAFIAGLLSAGAGALLVHIHERIEVVGWTH